MTGSRTTSDRRFMACFIHRTTSIGEGWYVNLTYTAPDPADLPVDIDWHPSCSSGGMRAAVTIVSTNRETLDGLQSYLRRAGVGARCTRDLAECTRFASESARNLAVVLFPDDFRRDKVLAALADLAALPRPVLAVLVTAHPRKFEQADGVMILPRPAWGWSILEAIRAHVTKGSK